MTLAPRETQTQQLSKVVVNARPHLRRTVMLAGALDIQQYGVIFWEICPCVGILEDERPARSQACSGPLVGAEQKIGWMETTAPLEKLQ